MPVTDAEWLQIEKMPDAKPRPTRVDRSCYGFIMISRPSALETVVQRSARFVPA